MGKESVLKRGGVDALALALLTAKPNGAELYFSEKVGLPGLRPAHVQQLSHERNIRVLDYYADMFSFQHFLDASMRNGKRASLFMAELLLGIG